MVKIEIRKIKELQHHYISDEGKVYSDYNGELKEIKQYSDSKGKYQLITISENGVRHKCLVHRLVALAFIPNPDNLPEVNHKDYNTKNNSLSNLEWCTTKENIEHMLKRDSNSAVRNFRECVLMIGDITVKHCKSINEACRLAHELFQVSYTSLVKHKHVRNIKVVCD